MRRHDGGQWERVGAEEFAYGQRVRAAEWFVLSPSTTTSWRADRSASLSLRLGW